MRIYLYDVYANHTAITRANTLHRQSHLPVELCGFWLCHDLSECHFQREDHLTGYRMNFIDYILAFILTY